MANKNELSVPTFLKQWRNHRGLTQEALAEKAGLTAPGISQLENEKQGFTDDSLARLALALDCAPAEILAYDPSKADSFWPLFQVAERLQGRDRQYVHNIMQAALRRYEGGPE